MVLNLKDVADDLESSAWVSNPAVHFWIGPGTHVVGYSMRGGKMYNLVLLCPDDLPEGVSRKPGDLEEMKALFTDWDPILMRFLQKVDKVDKWRLMHSKSPFHSSIRDRKLSQTSIDHYFVQERSCPRGSMSS